MGIQSSQSQKHDLTDLLGRWATGTLADHERLLAAVQRELRQIAGAHMRRERPEHTLQPHAALVNEAYLRLIDERDLAADVPPFFGIAARLTATIAGKSVAAARFWLGRRMRDAP